MDQHSPWWEGIVTYLQGQLVPLLAASIGIFIGLVKQAATTRTGLSEFRAEWRIFQERYDRSEKERAEFRALQAEIFDDLCKRLARLEERVETVSQESIDEQRRLFRLLREEGRGYGG